LLAKESTVPGFLVIIALFNNQPGCWTGLAALKKSRKPGDILFTIKRPIQNILPAAAKSLVFLKKFLKKCGKEVNILPFLGA
jgi:hypothetical protein